VEVLVQLVEQFGMPAVFVLMMLESALVPIPSELVMPLAGFMVSLGHFSILSVTLVASFANLVGSVLAYYTGAKARPFLPEFAIRHAEVADRFFERYGVKAVLFGRMLPAVRTFISLPAGLARVPVFEFVLFTFIGSLPWNAFLAYVGFLLGKNWELVHRYGIYFSPLILAGFVWFAIKSNKKRE